METLKYEEQLQKIFTNINDWLKFAEAKNFGLLSLNAAIVFGFTQIEFQDGSIIQKAGFFIFAPFALLSFLTSLISLFPIVSKIEKGAYAKSWINKFCNWIDEEKKFENIHFYGFLKGIDEPEFEAKFLSKTSLSDDFTGDSFTQYEKELATQILYNSRITWLKYQFFKIGAFFFLTGAILFVVALPLLKFFS
jgi:hypothetical protein